MSDIKTKLKELIFVPKCKCCHKPADEKHLCTDCRQELEKQRIPAPMRKIDKKFDLVDRAYGSYYYKGRAKQAVKLAKFKNPASFLAGFIDDISIDIMEIVKENNIDMVVASPYHKSKLYTQEYDLPQKMAEIISVYTGVENSCCIVKSRRTGRQHNLPLLKRKVNLVNAFEVTGDVQGRRILLIDDVITSGITVSTLATELKIAGAEKVYAWVYTYNT